MNLNLKPVPPFEYEHLRARIGFVLSAKDRTFESDIRAIDIEGVELLFSCMPAEPAKLSPLKRSRELVLHQIQCAAQTLHGEDELDVVSFAAGSLCALVGNARILEAVRQGTPNALVSSVHTATKRATKALQAKNVVIATGYGNVINNFISDAFDSFGVNVVSISGIEKTEHSNFSPVSPREIRNFALSLDRADADAIIISSTTLRAMEAIDELEQIAGKPVICSNQVAIWDALRSAGISDRLTGYGSLLQSC